MTILPISGYMVVKSILGSRYADAHNTIVAMLTATHMPFGIAWIGTLINDTEESRFLLNSSMEMAAIGSLALIWCGYTGFVMHIG